MILSLPPIVATLALAASIGLAAWAVSREPVPARVAPDPFWLDRFPVLERPFPEARFQDVAMEDTLDFCQDTMGIQIHRTEDALAYRNVPVSIRKRNTPAIDILRTIISQAAGDRLVLGSDGTALVVMSPDEASASAAGVDFWWADAFNTLDPSMWQSNDGSPTLAAQRMSELKKFLRSRTVEGYRNWDAELVADPETLVFSVRHSPIAIDAMRQLIASSGVSRAPPMQKRACMP